MTYIPPFNGGRINATISGNTAGAGTLISTGTMTLAGGNNITLSQNGNAITISGGAAGGFSAGLSNLGNTSGTTGLASNQLVFAGGNNITLSQSTAGGGNTLTISAASQTNQTIGLYALGNTTQNSSTTRDARSLSFNGLGAATVGYSNGSIQVSVPSQTVQTQSNIQAFYDGTNSISTGTIRVSNANGISFGINGQTLTASHNAITSQTNQSVGLYALGNTTQNSSTMLDARSLSFNGLGGVSVGYSNGSIQISGATGGAGGGGGIALANSQATYSSGTANLIEGGGAITIASTTGQSFKIAVPQTSSLSATGAISISTNGSTISIGAPTDATMSRYIYPNEYIPLNTIAAANNIVSLNYVSLDRDVSASQFRAIVSVSASTNTIASTNTYGLTAEVGVYTRNASTISKMSSGSQTWSGTYSTNSTASVGGVRELTMPMNVALTPGEYWFGLRMSSSSSNANVFYSVYVVSNQLTLHMSPGRFGAATNATQLLYPWHGLLATTSNALPSSATLNDVQGTGTKGSAAMYWFDLRNYTVL